MSSADLDLAMVKEAEALAGRAVEIVMTDDGKWVVEWLNIAHTPPPKADSPAEALKGFVEMLRADAAASLPQEPIEEDTCTP